MFHHSSSSAKDAAKDPICGMSVDSAKAKWVSDYQGTSYYFCGKGCKETFDKNPAGHIK